MILALDGALGTWLTLRVRQTTTEREHTMTNVSFTYNGLNVVELRRVLATWSKFSHAQGLVPNMYKDKEVTVKCEGPELFTCTVPPVFATAASLFSDAAFGTADERAKAESEIQML